MQTLILTPLLKQKISELPTNSGVYIMKDASGAIIYIGKAVVLKNRVKQYFGSSPKHPKVQAMVDNIADFDYIVTLSEKDALSLEANLINKYKPKYNILLKDDKASPYIKIDTRIPFPTVEITRKPKKDGARYFGPYFNGIYVKDIVGIISSAYGMRTCPKRFTSTRPCLNYHIKRCTAPCGGLISQEDYASIVKKVIAFLQGKDGAAAELIEQKMLSAAQNEDFERAIVYRNQLEMIDKLKQRTIATAETINDLDCFYYHKDALHSVISIVIVRNGKMMGARSFFITDLDRETEDLLAEFMTQYYPNADIPPEICVQLDSDFSSVAEFLKNLSGFKPDIHCPKKGIKAKLMDMAKDNASTYLEKNVEKEEREKEMTLGACERLAKLLGLKSVRKMECYDISNIQGTDNVSSQVVFIDGKPAKDLYRRYKIKTVQGADDFASMAETIKRRIERSREDEKFGALPDLIVIDGGKGQLSHAYSSMKAMGEDIPMVSLAKRDEEIYFVGESEPLRLEKRDIALRLMQRIRDEAHRFAVSYHRTLRQKHLQSELMSVSGVGKAKVTKLLARFDSYEKLKNAELSELCEAVDKKTAQNIYNFYKEKK